MFTLLYNPKDLDLIHPDCPNFKWYECWKSETAARNGIINKTDKPELLQNCREAVLHLIQPLRTVVGPMYPQSWYRGNELERILCNKAYLRYCTNNNIGVNLGTWNRYFKFKSHPKFGCIDIEVDTMSNDDLFDLIKRDFQFDEVIREYPVKGVPKSGWVHVSWAGNKNRGRVRTIGAR